jgi:hypothetical protein
MKKYDGCYTDPIFIATCKWNNEIGHMANACPRNKKAFTPSLFAMHITEFADYSSNSF